MSISGNPNSQNRLQFLIADPSQLNQKMLSIYLKNAGHHAHFVTTGHAALKSARDFSYDFILLSCHLSSPDVCTTAGALRSETPHSHPVIIGLSEHPDAAELDRCRQAGMDHLSGIPIRFAALSELIEQHNAGATVPPLPVLPDSMPVISKSHLEELRAGLGETVLSELIQSFLDSSLPMLQALELQLTQQDISHARRDAHQLKGTCATLGALRMTSWCEWLQHAPNRPHAAASAANREALQELKKEYAEVRRQLQQLLPNSRD